MKNKFGIPKEKLKILQERSKFCAYCGKKLIFPYDTKNRRDSATIEHLNFNGPFYWKDGLNIEDVVFVCGSCNSSRGKKSLSEWFKSGYCMAKNINNNTVSGNIKKYINKNK